jgi:nitroimidazol reductase NimA-like FMN-containing flavoprotein (pyridoxamine 5'-phosphate oxidase superfamily)
MSVKIQSTSSSESSDFITSFLNTHPSGVLATSDKAANPHGAVVYFELHDDFCITFATRAETQKYKNMEENSQVAFVVYDEKNQMQVQIFGHIEIIKDQIERLDVLNYMYRVSPKLSMPLLPPADRLLAGGYQAIRVVPQVIKMAIYSRPDEERDDIYEVMTFSQ